MRFFSLAVFGVFFGFQGAAHAMNPVGAFAAAQGPCPPGYMVYNSSSDGFCCRKLPPPLPSPTPAPQAFNGPCCKMVSNPSPVINCSLPPYNTPVNASTLNACVKAGFGKSCYWDASNPECRANSQSGGGGPVGTTGRSGSNNGSDHGAITSGGGSQTNGFDPNKRCCMGSNPACSAVDSIPVPSASFPTLIEKYKKCMTAGSCSWNPACALP